MSQTEDLNIRAVTAPVLTECLEVNMAVKLPVFVWGAPGIGKSRLVDQLGEKQGRKVSTHIISQWDAVDARGVPTITKVEGKNRTSWALPDMFPTDPEADEIIFLDEMNAAPQAVQGPMFQFILDRRIGEYRLPENVSIIAAGNRESDRGIAQRMSTPLADRFDHLELTVDNDAWEQWALSAGVHSAVISFVRWRPGFLHNWDARGGKCQATPRGWEYVSKYVTHAEENDVSKKALSTLVIGKIGKAVGAEFLGFLDVLRDLPDPQSILLDPKGSAIPSDPAVLYALCGALARFASPDNIGSFTVYAERLGAHVGDEYGALLVRQAISASPEASQTRDFIEWAANNGGLLV